jgi:hypothetical protein
MSNDNIQGKMDDDDLFVGENVEAYPKGERVRIALEDADHNSFEIDLSQNEACRLCKQIIDLFAEPHLVQRVIESGLWSFHGLGEALPQRHGGPDERCSRSSEPFDDDENCD